MTQLQNHGGTKRLYVTCANALTKDKAVSRVVVEIDTSQWSSRKKNIVIKSLRTGVAACGWETAELVESLARTIDTQINTVSRWRNYVYSDEVRPEKLDELLAYTSAWLRMDRAGNPSKYSGDRYYPRFERDALACIEEGVTPTRIPLNNTMTYDEKREFIHTYLKASEDRETEELERLIAAIEGGDTISVTYSIAN